MPRLQPGDAPEALSDAMDSQLRTTDMLRAVGAGNRLLKRLGLSDACCVIYGAHDGRRGALLLDPEGEPLGLEVNDDPWASIGALLLRFLSEEDT